MRSKGASLVLALLALTSCGFSQDDAVPLPAPRLSGEVTVEEALEARRSVRRYGNRSLTLEETGQLLWAAAGVTSPRGFRTAPSAGALYPFTVYLAAGRVDSLSPGIYRYEPLEHALIGLGQGDVREDLREACLGQSCVGEAPASIILVARESVTTSVYGDRGRMYVHMEAGHISQNVYLQCQALGLGTVAVGAFAPEALGGILGLPEGEKALYVLPVGSLQ